MDREQLAFEWNALPKYIYVNAGGQPWNFEADLANYNCCSNQFYSPWTFYAETNAVAQEPMDLTMDEVLAPFTLLNPGYNQLVQSFNENFFYVQGALNIAPTELAALEAMWLNRGAVFEALQREKEAFRATYEKKLAEQQALARIDPFEVGRYRLNSVNKVYSFLRRATLLDIFNEVEASKELPLVSTNNYYKVLAGFPYALEVPAEADTLFLFYRGEKLVLTFNGNLIDPAFELVVPRSEQIEAIKRLLKADRLELVKERLNVSLSFYTPQYSLFDFNKYVWADIIMNVASISSIFVIDEHIRAHKVGSSIYMFWLRGAAPRSFTLNARIEFDPNRKKYLSRVEVKLNDCEATEIPLFKEDLAAVLGYYAENADQVARAYNAYLTSKITLRKPAELEGRKPALKDIYPELFATGYTRSCQYNAEIIGEDDVKDHKGQLMLFPNTPEEGRQFYYSCSSNATHIYPGLRANNLENKDRFPYLPCCFRDDQLTKASLYKTYLEGGEHRRRPAEERRGFIKTDKTLEPYQIGEPPMKLKVLFDALGESLDIKREGTTKSPASVLECLLKEELRALAPKARLARIAQERRRLATLPETTLNVIQQETWDLGLDKARDILKDSKAFLDPRIFYSLLELVYGCRLVVLGRADFIYPHYAHTFAHFDHRGRVVIVYENYGGEAEHLTMPQFETFSGIAPIAESLFEHYSTSLTLHYVDRRGYLDTLLAPEEERKWASEIVGQHLNPYGQLIGLNIRVPDLGVVTYQLLYPYAPLTVPVTEEVRPNERAGKLTLFPVQYGERIYIIGEATPVVGKVHSWRKDFLALRKTSNLLIEQAKHALSQGEKISLGALTDVAKAGNRWLHLKVPTETLRKKLVYAAEQYRKYNISEFEKYREFTVVPNKYRFVDDFTAHKGEVVSAAAESVKWAAVTPDLEERPLVGASSFFMEMRGKVYNCFPVADVDERARDLNVCVFNTKRIFAVGAPASDVVSLLYYVAPGNVRHAYKCYLVTQ